MRHVRGTIALALLLIGVAVAASGCVLVPVGPGYAYRAPYAAPVVVAPGPIVVRRAYPYWW